MQKLFAILALFRKGNAVDDPALWKNGGMAAMALVSVLLALSHVARLFGWPLEIDEADAGAIATGLVTAIGVVSHLVSSKTVGLPADPASNPPDGSADRGSYGGA